MVRVFANGLGDLGSLSGRVIPKTRKMVLDASVLNTQHYKVRIKRKRVAPSPTFWCCSYRKVTPDYSYQLYLLHYTKKTKKLSFKYVLLFQFLIIFLFCVFFLLMYNLFTDVSMKINYYFDVNPQKLTFAGYRITFWVCISSKIFSHFSFRFIRYFKKSLKLIFELIF